MYHYSMKRRTFIKRAAYAGAALAGLPLLSGCLGREAAQPIQPVKLGQVRVGYLLGDIHHIAYEVAKDPVVGGGTSLYERYGVEVIDARGAPFANGGVEMDHFASGDVDMGMLGAPPAIIKHINAGVNTQIVGQVNEIGSSLIVAPGIEKFSDLRGKTVATPGHSTIQFFLLLNLAEKEGVDIKDINTVDMAPKDMRVKLEGGDLAGYIAWEPYASEAVVDGVGRVLASSNDIWPNHLDCVVATDKSFAGANEAKVVGFLRAHVAATDWINKALANKGSGEYTHLVTLATKFTGRNEKVVMAAFDMMIYKTAIVPSFKDSFELYAEKLLKFNIISQEKMAERGYLTPRDFVEQYVDESFLRRAGSV